MAEKHLFLSSSQIILAHTRVSSIGTHENVDMVKLFVPGGESDIFLALPAIESFFVMVDVLRGGGDRVVKKAVQVGPRH